MSQAMIVTTSLLKKLRAKEAELSLLRGIVDTRAGRTAERADASAVQKVDELSAPAASVVTSAVEASGTAAGGTHASADTFSASVVVVVTPAAEEASGAAAGVGEAVDELFAPAASSDKS